jgi:MoxR-like ATPase
MGAGKGKSRRVSAKAAVNKSDVAPKRRRKGTLDIQPDANGVSTRAFPGELTATSVVEGFDPNNVFMPEQKGSGKEGPLYMQEDYEHFAAVAEKLGLPIPRVDKNYHFSYEVKVAQNMLSNGLALGQRCFTIYGPPGTGKNTFIKQALGALTKMPVFEIDASSSDELEAAIGYDGIDTKEGKDGSIASETVEKRGKLTRAATEGAIIVLNEITELPRGQLTAIHNMVGSGVGDSDRYIVIKSPNSAEGETMIPVHPDTIFFFTYNPERSDRRPHQALLSRSMNFHIGHDNEEEEAHILALRTSGVLAENKQWVQLRESKGQPIELTQEEVAKTVKFMRELRTAYHNDELEHEPDMRTAVMFEASRQLEGAKETKAGIVFALNQLDFMFNQTNEPNVRQRNLHKYAASHFEEVEDLGTGEVSGFQP